MRRVNSLTSVGSSNPAGATTPILKRRSRSGFTLIELLVTIAITGILSVMMFSNFAKEKDRNALKAAVNQLQTDIKSMQTNAQSGIALSGVVPPGFGVHLVTGASSYQTFGDTIANNRWDATDAVFQTRNFNSTDVTIRSINAVTSGQTGDILFQSPNATTVLYYSPTLSGTMTVVLKSAKLGVCYSFTVAPTVGTVALKTFSSC